MRKIIAAFNMTLDGICDHTVSVADDELHQHYNDLLRSGDTLLYGRTTYQLMESFWPTVVKNPTGDQPIDEFAILIDNISKIVFSHTLQNVEWRNSTLAKRSLKEEVLELRQQEGRDILVGSRSLIIELMNQHLVDEFQICVQPILAGSGLQLFENIKDRIDLELFKTKTLTNSGSIILYYKLKNTIA